MHRNSERSDEEAILEVIKTDLKSYLAKDKKTWEKGWVHDTRMTSFMECGTLQIARGYEAFRNNVFAAMDCFPTPSEPIVQRENLCIHVNGDMAWATFDQIVTNADDPVAPPNFSHNFRLFEKIQSDWQVVFHGVWALPERTAADPTVEVDVDARILWMNPDALDALTAFEGLSVSHGKLRASRPEWDKALRAAITQADSLRAYGAFNSAARPDQQQVRFPVLLGEDENGRALFCFVRVANGRTYVSFGKNSAVRSQIELAAAVYGLSGTQIKLAQIIAEGGDLSKAADVMDITINTAKTHLSRMFDKTQARSQLELLRVFLSFSE